jgi:RNA 3'-terminal phosphate cyclase (ATP)
VTTAQQRPWLTIDGTHGEGGGQILRTGLALSLLTGYGLRLVNIRAQKDPPGLQHSHLAAIEAAKTIGSATVEGAELGSLDLSFEPGPIVHGEYEFFVEPSGSPVLVLQTILLPLLLVPGYSRVVLSGPTHRPGAPTYDYLEKVYLPAIEAMGGQVQAAMLRPGFEQAGGGRFQVGIRGGNPLQRIEMLQRGEISRRLARGIVAELPVSIARRELVVVQRHLDWPWTELEKVEVKSDGPGNVLTLEVEHACGTSMITGFGEKGWPSEEVAEAAVAIMQEFLDAEVPVDPYLADQLLLPMALAGGGAFRTMDPAMHTTTTAWLIQRFLAVEIAIRREGQLDYRVDVWRR